MTGAAISKIKKIVTSTLYYTDQVGQSLIFFSNPSRLAIGPSIAELFINLTI